MTQSLLYRHPAADEKHFEGGIKFITASKIDVMNALQKSQLPETGALVLFTGCVRNINLDKNVSYLEYEAHVLLAEKVIKEILEFSIKKWKLTAAFAQHRIGRLEISDCAVAVVTSHSHRSEAYQANQYIIDKIKTKAPIWKCEYYSDGSHKWGSNCAG